MNYLVSEDDPILHTQLCPIEEFTEEDSLLIGCMNEVMELFQGVGCAANQVGSSRRICVVLGREFVNPKIVWYSSNTDVQVEGCLSLPGVALPIRRSCSIGVEFYHHVKKDLDYTQIIDPWAARIMQHEVDHLDGILITDRYSEQNV